MQPYKLPLSTAEAEFIEKKSRFICNITQISSEEEAHAFIAKIRAKYKDANHNVFAYRVKDSNIIRFNDDGEPSGTAGMPLLDTFVKQDIYDFCAVATRYFGGIMLGGGGLVRAYSRTGSIGLEASGVGYMRELTLCSAAMPYALYEQLKRQVAASGATITDEDFGADVKLSFSLPTEDVPPLALKITEMAAGAVAIDVLGTKLGVFAQ
ncbi:MAG: YigZ family protein [Oscillospiraceae bacterium]|nr:YigZ family protein [Oscillospiraceae bacterium]